MVTHVGPTDYAKYGADLSEDPDAVLRDFDALQWALYWGDRPAMDTVASLILHGLFGRFPNVRVCLSEQGTVWLPYLLRKLDAAYHLGRRARFGTLDRKPSEIFREHFVVAPFPEENVARVVQEVGIEPIVFGSDFPHARGPRVPGRLRRGTARRLRAGSGARDHARQSGAVPGHRFLACAPSHLGGNPPADVAPVPSANDVTSDRGCTGCDSRTGLRASSGAACGASPRAIRRKPQPASAAQAGPAASPAAYLLLLRPDVYRLAAGRQPIRLPREDEMADQSRYQRIRSHRAPGVPGPLRSGTARQGDRRRRRRRCLHRRRLLRLPDEVRLGPRPLQAQVATKKSSPSGRGERRARRQRRRGQVHHGRQGPEPAAVEGPGRRLCDRVAPASSPTAKRPRATSPPARRRSSSPRPARAR